MIDCVAGYHLNPWTCGIAKFNEILARRLDVPVVQIGALREGRFRRPLLSLKLSEFAAEDVAPFDAWVLDAGLPFELFLHAYDDTPTERRLLQRAAQVYCGNAELFAELRPQRPDVQELWCPGMLLTPQRFEPSSLSVFTFGMAHKIQVPLYRRLQKLLEESGHSYNIYVSTALHENTSFDGSFVVRFEELQSIFGSRVYFLGYLSDTAVYNHLLDASILAAFFERGLRANNTTVNAAMECACAVVTNLDDYSPRGLVHLRNVIDVNRCERLPETGELRRIGQAARETVRRYGWDELVAQLRAAALR